MTVPEAGAAACPHGALFARVDRLDGEGDAARAALRASGPVVRVAAPAGGDMWVVTEHALARAVLADPRIVKDPAFAPPAWDPVRAGLEPTAAAQVSLTTLDGPAHTALRRAHAPLFTPQRMRAHAPRLRLLVDRALTAAADAAGPGGVVDLMAEVAVHLPAVVVLDVLGAPVDERPELARRVATAVDDVVGGTPEAFSRGLATLLEIAATTLSDEPPGGEPAAGPLTAADELRERMPAGTTHDDLLYALFGILLAGQLTTHAALGDVLAAALREPAAGAGDLVERTLRAHAPAAVSLWRFTATEVELSGHHLPARSPVLVDLAGIGSGAGRPGDAADLVFGSGPHFCLGAALARVELVAAVDALREGFPEARLAPGTRLRRVGPGGVAGERLATLPVVLRAATTTHPGPVTSGRAVRASP